MNKKLIIEADYFYNLIGPLRSERVNYMSIIEFIDFVCYQYDNNKTAVHFKAYSLAYRRCNAPFLFICSSSNFTIPWGESHRVYIGG